MNLNDVVAAFLTQIAQAQVGQLLASQAEIEPKRENGPVAQPLQRGRVWLPQNPSHIGVLHSERESLARHARRRNELRLSRASVDSPKSEQIVEVGSQRVQPPCDCGRLGAGRGHRIAVRHQKGRRNSRQVFGTVQTDGAKEMFHVGRVRSPRLRRNLRGEPNGVVGIRVNRHRPSIRGDVLLDIRRGGPFRCFK